MHAKKSQSKMLAAGALLIVGHWLDLYLMVMPVFMKEGPRIGWMELGIFLGLGALFLTVFDRAFRSAPAVPERDPYLQESLHHGR